MLRRMSSTGFIQLVPLGGVEAHPFANPTAPGCDNGGANCTNGNHGYSWNWNNGGTSGLPTGTYSDNFGYTNLLTNPDYTVFKSNWAWANKIDEKNLAVKFDLSGKLGELIDWTAGARYSDREVNYVHGRYLINGAGVGTGTAAPGGTLPGAGDPGGNCCLGAASGTWIYYSDPGYADIPYLTPGTNATGASLNLIYNNFANGPIAVKNPVTGGMTNPSTYLNTLWTQAGVANNTEAFFKDALNSYDVKEKTTAVFVMGDAGDDVFHANYRRAHPVTRAWKWTAARRIRMARPTSARHRGTASTQTMWRSRAPAATRTCCRRSTSC
jgi:iron complex outermembrane receptor protein